MKVLVVHNRYREQGGEDSVVETESTMLQSAGHMVEKLAFDNDVPEGGRMAELQLLLQSPWSKRSAESVRGAIAAFRPDVMHVHNFWMKASPSVHRAATSMGVPTVQTLHNFRLLCTNAQLLRNGSVCEDCVGKVPWRGVIRRCYHQSLVASAATAAMITANRLRGTWQDDVDAFIALTNHSRERFIEGGLPADRIFVKPNVSPDLAAVPDAPSRSRVFVFVGRLSPEKGVSKLLEAWKLAGLEFPTQLRIAGDGPERDRLQTQAASLKLLPPHVEFTGFIGREEVARQTARARALILPSLWYETFGLAVLEAAAAGRPSVVSAIGALPELVEDGVSGLTVPAGAVLPLSQAIQKLAEDDATVDRLGATARETYRAKYTPAQNLPQLLKVYQFAIESRKGR